MPAGYRTYVVGSALLVTRPEYFLFLRDALHAHETMYAYAAVRPDAISLPGRPGGASYQLETPHGEWVVRRYRRGGVVAALLGDRYLRVGAARPLRELEVSAAARARGVRTPEVMAVVTQSAGPFVRGELATAYVADSEDLAVLGFGKSRASAEQQHAAWEAVGRLVHELAAAGLSHPDLNLKNILIRWVPEAPEAWVVDLDRCTIGRADASAMWSRLRRSLAKWERTTGKPLAGELRAALQAGYRG